MKNRNTQNGPQDIISFGTNTLENIELITQDIAAVIRWYATCEGKYDGDEQSLYRWAQRLEMTHQLRQAS